MGTSSQCDHHLCTIGGASHVAIILDDVGQLRSLQCMAAEVPLDPSPALAPLRQMRLFYQGDVLWVSR